MNKKNLLLLSDFLFPADLREEHMKVCEEHQVKAFCKDGVEKAEMMYADIIFEFYCRYTFIDNSKKIQS